MASGAEHLLPGRYDDLAGHSTPPDALLRDLITETAERFPDRVRMQIGPQQGTFMTMLAGLMGARRKRPAERARPADPAQSMQVRHRAPAPARVGSQ